MKKMKTVNRKVVPHRFNKNVLSLALTTALCHMITTAHAAYDDFNTPIGDLEIYQSAGGSAANIMMMLDLSGSMGDTTTSFNGETLVNYDSLTEDFNTSCRYNVNNPRTMIYNSSLRPIQEQRNGLGTLEVRNIQIGSQPAINYTVRGCQPGVWQRRTLTQAVDGCTPNNGNIVGTSGFFTQTTNGPRLTPGAFKFVPDNSGNYFISNNSMILINDLVWVGTRQRYRRIEEVCGTYETFQVDPNFVENAPWDAATHGPLSLHLNRIERLKVAMIDALSGRYPDDYVAPDGDTSQAGQYMISSKNLVGLGGFDATFTIPNYDPRNSYSEYNKGFILVPAAPLTDAHRARLINTILSFRARGSTPSASAYAESVAYMQGKNGSNYTSSVSGYNIAARYYPDTIRNGNYFNPGNNSQYQCYGKGIYFLTDGEPNGVQNQTADFMSSILEPAQRNLFNNPPYRMTDVGTVNQNFWAGSGGWPLIGRMALAIRDRSDPYSDIKTATVGFGAAFAQLERANKITITDSKGQTDEIINCGATRDPDGNAINVTLDARQLCAWGRKENYTDGSVTFNDQWYGGGGFYVGSRSQDVTQSLIDFVNFGNNTLSTAPGGTISIPSNPYRTGALTPYAYLPVIQPNVGSNKQVWEGNLKKYSTDRGTLWGKDAGGNPERLYLSPTASSRGGGINDAAGDLWATNIQAEDNSDAHSGGFFAQLFAPDSSDIGSTRNVFVERDDAPNGLNRISVSSSGTPSGFAALTDPVFGSTDIERRRKHRILLNFLGYKISNSADAILDNTNTETLNMSSYVPAEKQRTVGGVIHSSPVLASYSAEVEEDGKITTDESRRDEYVMFGSMDGALHMVDVETGQEKWAMIFKEMLRTQPEGFMQGSSGSLKFGIDAPWVIRTEYNYEATTTTGESDRVTIFDPRDADDNPNDSLISTSNYIPMAGYGGFRLGAKGLYALNISSVESPEILFSITPDMESETARLHINGSTVSSSDYSNVGHIWSKPTLSRMMPSSSSDRALDVLVFGGGYDIGYESPDFVPPSDGALGSSVYISDAKTGSLKWSWDNPYGHSIVGGITALDRDRDGLFDYLYFADMGGNVFRADFVNDTEENFRNLRVTRVFDASKDIIDASGEDKLALRFYQKPVVSFYRDKLGKLFAVINIASGNRSSPLSKERDNLAYSNRVYGIFDKQITTGKLIDETGYVVTADLTEANLTPLNSVDLANATQSTDSALISGLCSPVTGSDGTFSLDTDGNYQYSNLCKQKVTLISEMTRGEQPTNGWYRLLDRFDGFSKVKNVKTIGDGIVRSSNLYISTYESDIQFQAANACSAEIRGATEVQQYCLPYGVCMADSSITGTGGYQSSGVGMQELTFGAVNAENTSRTTLIGNKTFDEVESFARSYGADAAKSNHTVDEINGGRSRGDIDEDGKDDYSNWTTGSSPTSGGSLNVTTEGGDGTTAIQISDDRYVLRPQQWYEVSE